MKFAQSELMIEEGEFISCYFFISKTIVICPSTRKTQPSPTKIWKTSPASSTVPPHTHSPHSPHATSPRTRTNSYSIRHFGSPPSTLKTHIRIPSSTKLNGTWPAGSRRSTTSKTSTKAESWPIAPSSPRSIKAPARAPETSNSF